MPKLVMRFILIIVFFYSICSFGQSSSNMSWTKNVGTRKFPASDTTHRSAARQLFYSIQQYMLSDKFDPKDKVDMAVIRDIFISPSKEQWDSYTKATPDELKPVKK